MRFKRIGLVADLMPHIRLMQMSGHFLFNYYENMGGMMHLIRVGYCCVVLLLVVLQYAATFGNLLVEADDVRDLATNTITVLFFTHCLTKYIYFAIRVKLFYRTFGIWNHTNSHPLFVESNNRYHAIAFKKMRQLFYSVVTFTICSAIAWTVLTFFEHNVRVRPDPENENITISQPLPQLLVKSFYPWNSMTGMGHTIALGFQVYYVFISLMHANLYDALLCSWLIFACEQLMHLKEILKPLMELSATLDTYVPKTADLFRAPSVNSQNKLIENDMNDNYQEDNGLGQYYINNQEFNLNFRSGALQTFSSSGGGIGPNGLTKKQEQMVRSAIKYWVERHKHVVRLVTAIGDSYGVSLLLHMLTSTVMLTLLAYQATKIDGITPFAASTVGYLIFALAQVFHFCIFGNRLIEESSSVMEAAYSCHWYDGSEEAKTFVQIVCQQCQKAMSVSGAKFFTISLDLFASVLGATVTYFMVLIQLK